MPVDCSVDVAVAGYTREIVRRLRELLDGGLRAAYVIGSLALGDYVPSRSDIDILCVCEESLPRENKQAIVDALSHPALACPTRGLELVLYASWAAAAPTRSPRFEINLNTGPQMKERASFDPSSDPAHWFVVDIAIGRQRAIPLVGSPASEIFAPIPRDWIIDSMVESLDWHSEHETMTHNTVLNACRSWRFVEEGVWDSKASAAAWARSRIGDPELVDSALAIREGRRRPDLAPEEVRALVERVRARILEVGKEEHSAPTDLFSSRL